MTSSSWSTPTCPTGGDREPWGVQHACGHLLSLWSVGQPAWLHSLVPKGSLSPWAWVCLCSVPASPPPACSGEGLKRLDYRVQQWDKGESSAAACTCKQHSMCSNMHSVRWPCVWHCALACSLTRCLPPRHAPLRPPPYRVCGIPAGPAAAQASGAHRRPECGASRDRHPQPQGQPQVGGWAAAASWLLLLLLCCHSMQWL